jgi:hypothetical protein
MEEDDVLFLRDIDVCNDSTKHANTANYHPTRISQREIADRKMASRVAVDRQKRDRFNSYMHEHFVKDGKFMLPFNEHIPGSRVYYGGKHTSWPRWIRKTSMLLHICIKTLRVLLVQLCETIDVEEVEIKTYEVQSRCYHIVLVHECMKAIASNPAIKRVECCFFDLYYDTYEALINLVKCTKSITYMKLTLQRMSDSRERELGFVPKIFGNAPTLTHLAIFSEDDQYNWRRETHTDCGASCKWCRNTASSLWLFLKINKHIVSFTGNVLTSYNAMIDETLSRVMNNNPIREFFPGFCVDIMQKRQQKLLVQ